MLGYARLCWASYFPNLPSSPRTHSGSKMFNNLYVKVDVYLKETVLKFLVFYHIFFSVLFFYRLAISCVELQTKEGSDHSPDCV